MMKSKWNIPYIVMVVGLSVLFILIGKGYTAERFHFEIYNNSDILMFVYVSEVDHSMLDQSSDPLGAYAVEIQPNARTKSSKLRPGRYIVVWSDYEHTRTTDRSIIKDKETTFRFTVKQGTKIVLLKPHQAPEMN